MGGFTKHPLKHSCLGYQVDVSLAFLPSCLLYSFQWTLWHGPTWAMNLYCKHFQAVKSKQPNPFKKGLPWNLDRVFLFVFVELFVWKFPRADERWLLTPFFFPLGPEGLFCWRAFSTARWSMREKPILRHSLAALLRFRWQKSCEKPKRWGEIWRKLVCSGKSRENGVLFVWFHFAGFEEIRMKNTHPFLVLTVNQQGNALLLL